MSKEQAKNIEMDLHIKSSAELNKEVADILDQDIPDPEDNATLEEILAQAEKEETALHENPQEPEWTGSRSNYKKSGPQTGP